MKLGNHRARLELGVCGFVRGVSPQFARQVSSSRSFKGQGCWVLAFGFAQLPIFVRDFGDNGGL